jgi:hypothetical protein
MDRREQPARHQPPGEVLHGAIYTAKELKARMGWTDSSMRSARRRGLIVRRDGKRVFVLGEDFIAFIKKLHEGATPKKYAQ